MQLRNTTNNQDAADESVAVANLDDNLGLSIETLDDESPASKKAKRRPAKKKTKTTKTRRKTCDRWVEREKIMLLKAIKRFGERNWNDIAKFVGSKNSDQCNQHWHRVLNPKICKKAWTKQEDDLLIQRVEKHGESSWKRIAEGLPGRTDIQCRHRFMMLKKYKTQGKKGRPITRRRKSRKSSTAKTFEDLEAELHKGSSEDVQLNQEKTEQELPTTAAAAATAGTDTPQQPVLVTPPISRDEDDQQLLQITSSLEVTRSLADWASLDCYEYIVNCKSERLESDPFFVQHTKHADELLMNALMEWHCILSESDSSSIETVSDLAYSSGSDEESPLPKRRKIDQTSDNFECNINGCK